MNDSDELVARFDARKDYLPVEELAQEVRAAVVRTFSARITSPAKGEK